MAVRRAAVLAAALAAAGALVAVALTGRGGPAVAAAEPAVAASARITPRAHYFGDEVRAVLDVSVDRARVDPATVSVRARFTPYRLTASDVETLRGGAHTIRRYSFRLQCVSARCVGRTLLRVPPARVRYAERGGAERAGRVDWPEATVGSRLVPGGEPRLRAELAREPSRFARDPFALGWALAGSSALLVLGAGAGVARRLRPRPALAAAPQAAPELPPLERALERVAAAPDGAVRRQALDGLSGELREADLDEPARFARRLAWSEAPPTREQALALVAQVRRLLEAAA